MPLKKSGPMPPDNLHSVLLYHKFPHPSTTHHEITIPSERSRQTSSYPAGPPCIPLAFFADSSASKTAPGSAGFEDRLLTENRGRAVLFIVNKGNGAGLHDGRQGGRGLGCWGPCGLTVCKSIEQAAAADGSSMPCFACPALLWSGSFRVDPALLCFDSFPFRSFCLCSAVL